MVEIAISLFDVHIYSLVNQLSVLQITRLSVECRIQTYNQGFAWDNNRRSNGVCVCCSSCGHWQCSKINTNGNMLN